jgi:hypothetical protein
MKQIVSRIILLVTVLALLGGLWLIVDVINQTRIVSASPQAATADVTAYYNLLGYEGIPTIGSGLASHAQPPPAGDYVTTHCRYIDVPNTTIGHYYLRYPLDLPDGAIITNVELYVADFYGSGSLWAYLRSRPWNSRDAGSTEGLALTPAGVAGDTLIQMSGIDDLVVDNETTEYWIDVSPQNSADPGQLCVYGIQVTFTHNLSFLPLIQNGG